MAHILLVEDDEMIGRMITLRLKMRGHDVDIAVNGKEGVESAMAGSYQIVLMDMHMPVMDGHEAVRILKDQGYSAPIVAVTASAMSQDADRAMRAGCDYVLNKPIGADFEDKIDAILGK